MPLTDLAITKAKPRERAYKLADEKGLFLLVSPMTRKGVGSISRLWRLKYRFGGKEKLLALGAYPEISLAEARKRRDTAREIIARGVDPSEARKTEKRARKSRAANAFEPIAREFVAKHANRWSTDYSAYVLRRLELNVFPLLGGRPIAEIDPPEVLDALRKIEGRGAHEMAQRVLQLCGQVFRYGIATGRCARDSAADLRGALTPHKPKRMAAVELDALPELLRRIDAYDSTECGGDPQTRLALQLLAVTFPRTIELRKAEWPEINFDKALWTVPPERAKMDDAYLIPLSSQSLDILETLRKLNGEHQRYIFPGVGRKGVMSENTILYALYRLGYRSRMTGHGFRAVASTILNEHGFNEDWIERQLDHRERNNVRDAYNRAKYLPQRREMMQWYADYLDLIRSQTSVIESFEARVPAIRALNV
jgi:integrase